VVNGIPLAMHSNVESSFWKEESDAINRVDIHTKTNIGIPLANSTLSNHAATCIWDTKCGLDQRDNPSLTCNARQSFELLKQDIPETKMTMPKPCNFDAPQDINVYTDGSWLHAIKTFLGIGGAGVWWPNRTLSRDKANSVESAYLNHVSHAEDDFANIHEDTNGLRLFTKIGGFSGSSTRTELAAGIIAISAHGPVHIGSDSQVFVNSANEYIDMINKELTPKKPWRLISDGDSWEHFFNAITIKTTRSIKIQWVKGHATEEHISKGITTFLNKQGNDMADNTADLGTEQFGK